MNIKWIQCVSLIEEQRDREREEREREEREREKERERDTHTHTHHTHTRARALLWHLVSMVDGIMFLYGNSREYCILYASITLLLNVSYWYHQTVETTKITTKLFFMSRGYIPSDTTDSVSMVLQRHQRLRNQKVKKRWKFTPN